MVFFVLYLVSLESFIHILHHKLLTYFFTYPWEFSYCVKLTGSRFNPKSFYISFQSSLLSAFTYNFQLYDLSFDLLQSYDFNICKAYTRHYLDVNLICFFFYKFQDLEILSSWSNSCEKRFCKERRSLFTPAGMFLFLWYIWSYLKKRKKYQNPLKETQQPYTLVLV